MGFNSAFKGLIVTSVFVVTDDVTTNVQKFISNTEQEMYGYGMLLNIHPKTEINIFLT
jgi:hypothetical protein